MSVRPPAPDSGLCATCAHAKTIASARGSTFTLCERAEDDPRYRKYPALPVFTCDGFERRASSDGAR
jgi:hypothetical protein